MFFGGKARVLDQNLLEITNWNWSFIYITIIVLRCIKKTFQLRRFTDFWSNGLDLKNHFCDDEAWQCLDHAVKQLLFNKRRSMSSPNELFGANLRGNFDWPIIAAILPFKKVCDESIFEVVHIMNRKKICKQQLNDTYKSSYWRRCILWIISRQSLNTLFIFSVSTAHVKCG